MGVTGGTPLGFDIGADSRGGSTLKGLDLVSTNTESAVDFPIAV